MTSYIGGILCLFVSIFSVMFGLIRESKMLLWVSIAALAASIFLFYQVHGMVFP